MSGDGSPWEAREITGIHIDSQHLRGCQREAEASQRPIIRRTWEDGDQDFRRLGYMCLQSLYPLLLFFVQPVPSTVPGTDGASLAVCCLGCVWTVGLLQFSSVGLHLGQPQQARWLCAKSIAHGWVLQARQSGAQNNPVGKSKCNFSSWFCLECITNWNHFVSECSLENVSERQRSPLRLILKSDFMFFTFVSIFAKDQVQFLKLPDVLAQLQI